MKFVSECARTLAGDSFEESCEMLRILEAKVVGYNAYVIVGGGKTPFCLGYNPQ